MAHAKEWAIRAMHEAHMYEQNVFVTLTYRDQDLPQFGSLEHSHFQKFMKRLRKARSGQTIRYLMCGEYGEQYDRPHYHALLFGIDFDDKYPWERRNGNTYYRSAELEKLWPFGFSSVGNVTWESAQYVARYIYKKQYGQSAHKAWVPESAVDSNGEIKLKAEYACMSRNAGKGKNSGIGAAWYEKYGWTDCHRQDFVVMDGRRYKPPRYYDELLSRTQPEKHEALKRKRRAEASKETPDQTPERLAVREFVLAERTKKLKRGYEDKTT